MSSSDSFAPQYPPTLPTSLISDDDNDEVFIPIIGNPAQLVPYTLKRRPHPLHLTQQMTPITDTPECPTPEKIEQSDIFRPHDLPDNPSTSASYDNPPPPNISRVANGLQNMTLHPHPARSEWVTGCFVCGETYDPVIEETVADYLNPTTQPVETVRERQHKRNAFIDGIQSGVFTFLPPGVSQAAACDGLIYSVNYKGQNLGMQGYALPFFEH